MIFEFDPAKSAANEVKHGIDFVAAQQLWRDERLILAPAKDRDEARFMAIGKIEGRLWSAIFTARGEATRMISVRRSRKAEVELYEGLRTR